MSIPHISVKCENKCSHTFSVNYTPGWLSVKINWRLKLISTVLWANLEAS